MTPSNVGEVHMCAWSSEEEMERSESQLGQPWLMNWPRVSLSLVSSHTHMHTPHLSSALYYIADMPLDSASMLPYMY